MATQVAAEHAHVVLTENQRATLDGHAELLGHARRALVVVGDEADHVVRAQLV